MAMKNKYIVHIIVLILSHSLLAQIPSWFGNPIPGYSSSVYISGEGEGASYSEAIANAQAAVASQIRVSIKSQVDSYISEVSDNDKVEEGRYNNSRKMGTWIKYWPNGNIRSSINYRNGRTLGEYVTYFQNGNSTTV